MRISLSIDEQLLHEADKTAREMGLSRSRLFAQAIGEFLEERRQEKVLLVAMKCKFRRTIRDRW